jgi:hypothetical protein
MRININKTAEALRSRRFYLFTLILFLFESLWIAFSARYPQAFDESFHFGLIKIYSHVWSPFLSHQPPNASAYGAVASDPSYLYHYLMSFPLRIIRSFIGSESAQIIILRVINILLFGIGLVLFKKVLKRAGVSEAASNMFLFLFILIPVVPLLAGQINYDNLLFPLVALTCLLCFKMSDDFKKKQASSVTLTAVIGVGLLASLVTYAYLPILLGIAVYVLILSKIYFNLNARKILGSLKKDYISRPGKTKVLVAVFLVLSLGLFFQRYGLNLIRYHSINPDCAKILSVKECDNYSAWSYTYHRHIDLINKRIYAPENIISYAGSWLYWMWFRLFFAVSGPDNFTNYPPLPLPSLAALLIFVSSVILFAIYFKRVFKKDPYLLFLLIASLLYTGTLFIKGYGTYKSTGIPENMNGRYLLSIIPMLAPFFMAAFKIAFENKQRLKYLAALVVLIMFIEGGGLLTFIIRSDSTWYWKNNTVVTVNNTARNLLRYEVIKGSKYYETNAWFYN